jgi:hypothetical protein
MRTFCTERGASNSEVVSGIFFARWLRTAGLAIGCSSLMDGLPLLDGKLLRGAAPLWTGAGAEKGKGRGRWPKPGHVKE